MPSSSKKVFFGGHVFHVYENVYEPAEDSFLFAENFSVTEGDSVVDIGTGCGILGVLAANQSARVFAIDINPHAVRCAKENAELNHVVGKMFFLHGDLLTSLRTGVTFDLILFNAPYLPCSLSGRSSWLERAWAGGNAGRPVIDRFISEIPKYLKHRGRVFLMQSTLSDINKTVREFENKGLKTNVVAKRALPFFETIVLMKAEFHS